MRKKAVLQKVESRLRNLEPYREWVDAETFAGMERVGTPEGLQGAIPSKRYPLIGDGVAEILRSFAQLIKSFGNTLFWNVMLAECSLHCGIRKTVSIGTVRWCSVTA